MNNENMEKKSVQEDQSNEQVVMRLTSQQLELLVDRAAKTAAAEAIRVYESRQQSDHEERVDRRLMNTKLLLRNYRMLKAHTENSVFSRQQMDESAEEILESLMSGSDTEVIIDSIKRSVTRTAIIVDHIDTMLGLYEIYCGQAPQPELETRRYSVVYDMYIADPGLSAIEIATKQNMSKENVYADLKTAIERLTALIFGVDGLHAHSNHGSKKH